LVKNDEDGNGNGSSGFNSEEGADVKKKINKTPFD
jgi:hypothetical protein